jgi:hypothetical protein
MMKVGSAPCSALDTGNGPGRAGVFLRLVAATAVVVLGAACTEGYPSEDAPFVHPFDLTQAQRLAAMNRIGQDAHQHLRWRYHLEPGCVLVVKAHQPDEPTRKLSLPLLDATVNNGSDDMNRTFNVLLQPANPANEPAPLVLAAHRRPDALRMRSLLQSMQFSCRSEMNAVGLHRTGPRSNT